MPSTVPEGRGGSGERTHVAAAVVVDAEGRILIARRPNHVHQGGLWEFPGGKVELGESAYQALVRELHEEVHLDVEHARPLIRIPYDYPDKAVLLDVWRVERFGGDASGREGQPVRWVSREELPQYRFPAANAPIVAAARLPDLYLITGDFADFDDFTRRLRRALAVGISLVQLRAPGLKEQAFARLAEVALSVCRMHGARLLLNASPRLAQTLGADGVHLNGERLRACSERPLGPDRWVAASVHDIGELELAQRLGVDFVVFGPIRATATHPAAQPVGWQALKHLTEQAALPVYALGGVGPTDRACAFEHGAQGVAAVRALWDSEDR